MSLWLIPAGFEGKFKTFEINYALESENAYNGFSASIIETGLFPPVDGN